MLSVGTVTFQDMLPEFGAVSVSISMGNLTLNNVKASSYALDISSGNIVGSAEIQKEPCSFVTTVSLGDISMSKMTFNTNGTNIICKADLTVSNGNVKIDEVYGFAGTYRLQTDLGQAKVGGNVVKTKDEHSVQNGNVGTGMMSFDAVVSLGNEDVTFK